jgi:membrane AbrB-like protein
MELVRSLVAATVGGLLFERFGVPAGALIGAMVGVAAVGLGGFETTGSGPVLRTAAFVVIGWELGSQVTSETIDTVRRAAIPIIVVVFGLLVASAVLAWVLHLAGVDVVTAYLAASPGGLSQMVALSTEFGANAVVVSVVHLIRVITVILTAPWIARLIVR